MYSTRFSRLLAAVLVTPMLAACGGPPAGTRNAPSAAAPAATTPGAPPPARRPDASAPPPASATKGDTDTYEPLPDTHTEDAALPRGTITVELRDADDKPAPHESVFLAQISTTPAPDVPAETDARGRAALSAPAWVGGSARVVTGKGSGVFFTEPFQLPSRGGVHVVLHTYACSKQLEDTLTAFQSIVFVEAHGGGLKVTQALRSYNFARVAWLPRLQLDLPGDASEFDSAIETNSSLAVQREGDRAVILGTMAPGKHELQLSFLLPLHGDGARFRIAMPPHVAQARVLAQSSGKTRLVVKGFPEATPMETGMLGTEFRVQRQGTPLTEVDVEVHAVASTSPSQDRAGKK